MQEVSIVIPVYNDPDGLRKTIDSILSQTYDQYELIISVTPSSGETLAVARSYEEQESGLITIVEVPNRGRAAGRNAGIEEANGDVIAFVDADIRVPTDWLELSITAMNERAVAYLTCDIKFTDSDAPIRFIERYDRALSIPVAHYVEEYQFAPTASLFVTRELIDDVGRFDSRLTSAEDKEFGTRVHDAGYELYFASEISTFHPPRTTLSSQRSKAIRIGRGTQQLRMYYPERFAIPSLFSPISYAPPNPSRLQSRIASNQYEPSTLEFIIFYMFNYFLKLVQQYGRWVEVKNTKSSGIGSERSREDTSRKK